MLKLTILFSSFPIMLVALSLLKGQAFIKGRALFWLPKNLILVNNLFQVLLSMHGHVATDETNSYEKKQKGIKLRDLYRLNVFSTHLLT